VDVIALGRRELLLHQLGTPTESWLTIELATGDRDWSVVGVVQISVGR
jgi:hypothetical protein